MQTQVEAHGICGVDADDIEYANTALQTDTVMLLDGGLWTPEFAP